MLSQHAFNTNGARVMHTMNAIVAGGLTWALPTYEVIETIEATVAIHQVAPSSPIPPSCTT